MNKIYIAEYRKREEKSFLGRGECSDGGRRIGKRRGKGQGEEKENITL